MSLPTSVLRCCVCKLIITIKDCLTNQIFCKYIDYKDEESDILWTKDEGSDVLITAIGKVPTW